MDKLKSKANNSPYQFALDTKTTVLPNLMSKKDYYNRTENYY